jgi:hypothetical protein
LIFRRKAKQTPFIVKQPYPYYMLDSNAIMLLASSPELAMLFLSACLSIRDIFQEQCRIEAQALMDDDSGVETLVVKIITDLADKHDRIRAFYDEWCCKNQNAAKRFCFVL